MSDDLYATDESSGLLTHFIGTVKDSVWSTFFAETEGKTTGDFANETLLFWHVTIDDVLQGNYEASGTPPESISTSFGIGKGWLVDPENPDLIEHPDDTATFSKKFHANSGMGKFVDLVAGKYSKYDGALTLDGDGEVAQVDLTGVRRVHAERGVKTLRQASIWNGLIFEFRGLGYPRQDKQAPRARAMPVHFMGVSGEAQVTPQSGGQSISTAASNGALGDSAPAVEQWKAAGADEATVAMLMKLWETSSDPTSFIGNASLLPGVKSSDDLAKAVADSVGT